MSLVRLFSCYFVMVLFFECSYIFRFKNSIANIAEATLAFCGLAKDAEISSDVMQKCRQDETSKIYFILFKSSIIILSPSFKSLFECFVDIFEDGVDRHEVACVASSR